MAFRRINTDNGFIEFDNDEEYKKYVKSKRIKWTIGTIVFLVIVSAPALIGIIKKGDGKGISKEIQNRNSEKSEDTYNLETEQKQNGNNEKSDGNIDVSPTKLSITNVDYADNVEAQGNNTYVPTNMIDGNPATAWAVNLDQVSYGYDKLSGPTFTVRCKKLSHIIIHNGYSKSEEVYNNNARALRIIFCNVDYINDDNEQASYLFEGKLNDTPEKQILEVSPDIKCNNDIKKIKILFPIDGLRDGTECRDLCVSEIEFWGY